MARPKILVIDDDKNISRLVEFGLKGAEMDPIIAHDGQEGMRSLYAHQPDLVILDIMMPKMDGWTVCQRIREMSSIPIIMVTARDADADIIKGLDLGADDFVVKPVRMPVLLARVRACLRRAQAAEGESDELEVTYSDDRLQIDLQMRAISVEGQPVKLTPTEYNLLARLVRSAGRTLTYRQLLEDVWGWEYIDDIDYLRVYIWHLRQKLEQDSRNPSYILTEHGVGYRFARQT